MSSYTKMQGLDIDFASGAESGTDTIINGREERTSEAVEFSSKIVEVLKNKMEKHNSDNDREVTLNQLKQVFKRGAAETADLDKGLLALARVNMFLKMVKGDKSYFKQEEFSAKANLDPEESLDISDNFYPNEEDYLEAKEDIVTHSLGDYNFMDVDDIYLETEEELRAEAADWINNIIN